MRRATADGLLFFGRRRNFYPRSPCGERLHLFASSGVDFSISIHALLAESDTHADNRACKTAKFLSTLSLRRATQGRVLQDITPADFYPRSPCGERRPMEKGQVYYIRFLSTLSLRRATIHPRRKSYDTCISIHALLAESDLIGGVNRAINIIFLSTLSLRRATPWG